MTMDEIDAFLLRVMRGDDRGYKVTDHDEREVALATVKAGLVTPANRSWGHRLTKEGRVWAMRVRAEQAAQKKASDDKLRAHGLDPDKTLAEMTEEEVERFIAMKAASS